jgi:hypothetical protein
MESTKRTCHRDWASLNFPVIKHVPLEMIHNDDESENLEGNFFSRFVFSRHPLA